MGGAIFRKLRVGWSIGILLLLVGLATAERSFRGMITQRVIKNAVSCLADDIREGKSGSGKTTYGGLVWSAGICARFATYQEVFGKNWYKLAGAEFKGVRETARSSLKDVAELKATYLRVKPDVLLAIVGHPGLAAELIPLLTDLRRYFIVGGVDQATRKLLAERRDAEKVRWGHVLAGRDAELRVAYERLLEIEKRLESLGGSTVAVFSFEWAERRREEAGPHLLEAWAWVIGDLIDSLAAAR